MDTVWEGEDGINWESSTEAYTLLCAKLIVSGNLLYDTESSNLVLCDNTEGWEVGGRFMREGPYVYLWLIHVNLW